MSDLEARIGYRFKDRSLLLCALTHTSYVNEHPGEVSYERLEFLGDAVLEMISSAYLYRHCPELREGDLTKLRASLVCEPALAKTAKAVGLERYLRLGRGEEAGGGRSRSSILCDITEAVIGAMYQDSGEDIRVPQDFILREILPDESRLRVPVDAKSELQELLQRHGQVLTYELLKEEGPQHCKHYEVAALCDGRMIGRGEGRSKKLAEHAAAEKALEYLAGSTNQDN